MRSVLYVRDQDPIEAESGPPSPNWSAALPLALEKYGFLDVDVTDHNSVTAHMLVDYPLVIVGRPSRAWPLRCISALLDHAGEQILESPPPEFDAALGIQGDALAGTEGQIRVSDDALSTAAARYGLPMACRIHEPRTREVALDPMQAWQAIPGIPLTATHAAAWRKLGWRPFRRTEIRSNDTVLMANWAPAADEQPACPAIVRRDKAVGLLGDLLCFIGQAYSAEPFEPGEWRSAPRVTGAEAILLGLIDMGLSRALRPRLRVRPWPAGRSWALTIRHDFDVPVPLEEVATTIASHSRLGTSATWYWRARHVYPPSEASAIGDETVNANACALLVSRSRGQEVALHTEALWRSAEHEREALEEVIGRAVIGTSAHGDPGCFRYQGAPNLLWVESHAMTYTELLNQAHLHPHRAALMQADGRLRETNLFCLPHHETFDRSTRDGDTNAARLLDAHALYVRSEGYLQIMSRPDVHQAELFDMLAALPRRRRLDWTSEQVVRWWETTHSGKSLEIEARGPGVFELTSATDVRDLVVEILAADGSEFEYVCNLAAGMPIRISQPLDGEAQ